MQRNLNKSNRQLPQNETEELFAQGHHGILAVNGEEGYPYAVPVNYVYLDGKIYIHSAQYGYKMEMIEKDPKVCFSAILRSEIVPERFTAKFESVVATGKISLVEEEGEKRRALETFIKRFSPDYYENGIKFINASFDKVAVLRIDVEEITGKAYRGGQWK